MKKLTFTAAVIVFALLLGFSLSFAVKKSKEEPAPSAETEEPVPQGEVEVSGADDNEVDPFITKNRENIWMGSARN